MDHPELSFIVPVKNEDGTLAELLARVESALADLGRADGFELIFIDDGSDDNSWSVCRSLVQSRDGRVRAIRFRRNLGKAAALAAGFEAARGNIVFTLDADLQDDPREIGRFLAKLDEGYDVVSGWKKVRHDPWHKVLPSRVFNAMLSRLTGTFLHDHNCGFKCYRASAVKELVLYGEMHRMVPALSSIRGFRAGEIEVTHHPRRYGKSKYGMKRFLRGFMDMLTVAFLQNFRERPLHLMGGLAFTFAVSGVATMLLGMLRSPGATSLAMEIAGGCIAASALPLLAIGLMAELLVHSLAGQRPVLPIAEVLPRINTEVSVDTSLSEVTAAGPYAMPSPANEAVG
jgi:dolichol-phosphate mannosyltransferase